MIIGLGHTARVGKDTVADYLVEDYGFTRLAFADAPKELTLRLHGGQMFEAEGFGGLGFLSLLTLVQTAGWDWPKTNVRGVRDLLVKVGNDCREVIGSDVWINVVVDQFHASENVVVTDVRYPHEASVMRDFGKVWRITRPGFEPLDNVADQALAEYPYWDAHIENDGTFLDLHHKVDAEMQRLGFGVNPTVFE